MNTKKYRIQNGLYRLWMRIIHPWPIYRKVGGIDAVIIKADGTKEDLGRLSDTYAKRRGWGK